MRIACFIINLQKRDSSEKVNYTRSPLTFWKFWSTMTFEVLNHQYMIYEVILSNKIKKINQESKSQKFDFSYLEKFLSVFNGFFKTLEGNFSKFHLQTEQNFQHESCRF